MSALAKTKTSRRRLPPAQIAALKALAVRIDREESSAIKTRARAAFHRHDLARTMVARLKARRLQKGLSLADVAARSGIAKPNLSRLENSPHVSPTLDTLSRYAASLGLTVRIELAVRN